MENLAFEILQHLYEKFQKEHYENNQIMFVLDDYQKFKGAYINDTDVTEINKILSQHQTDGYIVCPRLKDLDTYAGWIKLTEKTFDFFGTEQTEK